MFRSLAIQICKFYSKTLDISDTVTTLVCIYENMSFRLPVQIKKGGHYSWRFLVCVGGGGFGCRSNIHKCTCIYVCMMCACNFQYGGWGGGGGVN